MFDIHSFAQGLVLGLGMFICPGPKDILILRQALFRRPAAELIAVGVLSDVFLIGLGIAGLSAILTRMPALQKVALSFGACLMLLNEFIAAKRAMTGSTDAAHAVNGHALPRGKSFVALLTVSFLNPVAWLDTVLVIGSTGAALALPMQPSFAGGAIAASFLWFATLVAGARYASKWMTSPGTWRGLDAFVATAMIGLAVYIGMGLLA